VLTEKQMEGKKSMKEKGIIIIKRDQLEALG